MAFIRRVRTSSGATAVQVAEYRDGRQRIVRHFGSAHSDVELGILIEQAERWLAGPDQGTFDLDVAKQPAVTALVSSSAQRELLATARPPGGTDGPGRVTSTDSRLLCETLAGVYEDLGFGGLSDRVFCDLVIARIVEPTSLLDVGRVLADLGRRPASHCPDQDRSRPPPVSWGRADSGHVETCAGPKTD